MDIDNLPDYPPLDNPPISAVILQLTFDHESRLSTKSINSFKKDLKKILPKSNNRFTGKINLDTTSDSPKVSLSDSKVHAIEFASESGKRKFILGLDKLNYESTEEYDTWEKFWEEPSRSLKVIQQLLKGVQIRTCSLRYVNTIKVAEQRFSPKDYFNVYIDSFDDLDITVKTFSFNYTSELPERRGFYRVVNTLEPITQEGVTPFILDIDVHLNINDDFDLESCEKWCETLRKIKNHIFFTTITEKTKNTF